jgi:hypothetical protein
VGIFEKGAFKELLSEFKKRPILTIWEAKDKKCCSPKKNGCGIERSTGFG